MVDYVTVHIPKDLQAGGRKLWREVVTAYDLDGCQLVTLQGACRLQDRADSLAPLAAEGDAGALRSERESLLAVTRLITALRLPDDAGRRPQLRSVRGVQRPSAGAGAGGTVSALQRAIGS